MRIAFRIEGTVENDVAVTYWMNNLQGIDHNKPLFISLNPPFEPAPALTFGGAAFSSACAPVRSRRSRWTTSTGVQV